jgi:transglutaminase-like putative cysteine protease
MIRRNSGAVARCIGAFAGVAHLLLFAPLIASAGGTETRLAKISEEPGSGERIFLFEYEFEVHPTAEIEDATHVFVPVARDTEVQEIVDLAIESDVNGSIEREDEYGNRYWHALVPAGRSEPTTITFVYTVKRRVLRAGDLRDGQDSATRFLSANDRVVVGHPILEPILAEIRSASPDGDKTTRARAIYDWVVDNVEYKKVGTGWGNGDTFWACSERYGNCTDFHSLFISLARTEGIPARFEMGFPIPADRKEGEISGYHCWVEFWLPEVGWVPIGASEAFKHPEKRELFYGTHPADRFHMTTGRDLRLGAAHRDRSLNYFVYPYLEVNGERSNVEITKRFSYRELEEPESQGSASVVKAPRQGSGKL